jgi:hypothetical protein
LTRHQFDISDEKSANNIAADFYLSSIESDAANPIQLQRVCPGKRASLSLITDSYRDMASSMPLQRIQTLDQLLNPQSVETDQEIFVPSFAGKAIYSALPMPFTAISRMLSERDARCWLYLTQTLINIFRTASETWCLQVLPRKRIA